MKNNILFALFLSLLLFCSVGNAQQKETYDLNSLLKQGKLVINANRSITEISDGTKKGLSLTGIVWLKGVDFKTGTIDVDLRGKDVFQQSFLGIAFHGVDTVTYDAIYFRPFNFQSPDTLRRKHTVQYISEPNFSWDKLRAEHPLVYENAVTPFPLATAWFHAQIVITEDEVVVYVNHATKPSLTVKKLNNRQSGLIGLWNDSLPGDFANLVIKQ
ncbi:hypothetical protein [Mucilaginibacter sp. FT3.2]|uniref:hypothetical protein n=1 Tax=Mucilaginibacter sp. FT3.2 TaxID=2723090 RepID=UPI0016106AFC|nr:hypothetical protein [Mucilaginibacter sp. FT3.2]MBB6234096.1 hypothetical protein [Mucilaginibacter sp. FT3.2]